MKLEFKIPEKELLTISNLLSDLAKNAIGNGDAKNLTVKLPNPASTVVTYAYRELCIEQKNQGLWGKIKIPNWLINKTNEKMLTVTMQISDTGYKQMLKVIKKLYPTVFADAKINKMNFIAALGIAYAHRIISGQITVKVAPVPISNFTRE